MQKNRPNKTTNVGRTMISVDINGDGHKTRIDMASLHPSKFTSYHGTTASGEAVNSINAMPLGKSIVLRSGKRGPALAVTQNEMEVFAAKFLADMGYTVTATKA